MLEATLQTPTSMTTAGGQWECWRKLMEYVDQYNKGEHGFEDTTAPPQKKPQHVYYSNMQYRSVKIDLHSKSMNV